MSIDNFKNISFKQRSHCMVCSKPLESPLLNLPNFPLTEIYTQKKLEEKIGFLDQFFHVCDHCSHGELSNVIPPSILYDGSYFFRTSTSASGSKVNDIFLDFIFSVGFMMEFTFTDFTQGNIRIQFLLLCL